jgi:hypothetical protein
VVVALHLQKEHLKEKRKGRPGTTEGGGGEWLAAERAGVCVARAGLTSHPTRPPPRPRHPPPPSPPRLALAGGGAGDQVLVEQREDARADRRQLALNLPGARPRRAAPQAPGRGPRGGRRTTAR